MEFYIKIKTQPGGVHPKARRARFKSVRRGSWSQSRFRTGGVGKGVEAGAVDPMGTMTTGHFSHPPPVD